MLRWRGWRRKSTGSNGRVIEPYTGLWTRSWLVWATQLDWSGMGGTNTSRGYLPVCEVFIFRCLYFHLWADKTSQVIRYFLRWSTTLGCDENVRLAQWFPKLIISIGILQSLKLTSLSSHCQGHLPVRQVFIFRHWSFISELTQDLPSHQIFLTVEYYLGCDENVRLAQWFQKWLTYIRFLQSL